MTRLGGTHSLAFSITLIAVATMLAAFSAAGIMSVNPDAVLAIGLTGVLFATVTAFGMIHKLLRGRAAQ